MAPTSRDTTEGTPSAPELDEAGDSSLPDGSNGERQQDAVPDSERQQGAAPDDERQQPAEADGVSHQPSETDPERQVPATSHPHDRPLHWVRGGITAIAGALPPFLIMSSERHFSFAVPVGFLGCAVSSWGILDLFGTFDDADPAARTIDNRQLFTRIFAFVLATTATFLSLRLAVAGTLPPVGAGIAVPASFLACIVTGYRVVDAIADLSSQRALLQRHGFWLAVVHSLLYLPLLGSFGLIDPWETHYGEVAREMLARDDWISLWWAQDGYFWSKPVLNFWAQGLSFSLLGVDFAPGQMLTPLEDGGASRPEWAARMPVFLLSLFGLYLLYKGASKALGRNAAFWGSLAVLTTPYWFFLARQSMTDMPYVGPLTAGMGLLMLAFHTRKQDEVRRYELKLGRTRLQLSAYHGLMLAVVLLVLPQLLYLLSRNVTLYLGPENFGFAAHLDQFMRGSPGNCGLPGNVACRPDIPVNKTMQPAVMAVVWAVVLGALLLWKREERRIQQLAFLAAWFAVALSAMGKGAPGLVLPVFVALVYVGATRRWKQLEDMQFLGLVLLVAVIVLPWYLQMYWRHGQPFIDRLLFHDMYKRAFVHVHDTNAGVDVSFRYYVWQLGYGLFPWTGVGAAGLIWWLRRGNEQSSARNDAAAFLLLWFIAAFSMFTISLTKFHHYIFPAVPPIGILAGIVLQHMFGRRSPRLWSQLWFWAACFFGVLLCWWGSAALFEGAIGGGLTPKQELPPSNPGLGWLSLGIGGAALAGAAWLWWRAVPPHIQDAPDTERTSRQQYRSQMLGAIGIASAIVLALIGRDMFHDAEGGIHLLHLFTYNYSRPWPEVLSFEAPLKAFTVVAAGACLMIAITRLQPLAAASLVSLAIIWAAWSMDVYLPQLAPHWGQRETVLTYYEHRKSSEEPLVAYQMNWKGENFYTGNQLPVFVQAGSEFKKWLDKKQKQGTRVMYFMTEHSRLSSLKADIKDYEEFTILTGKDLNNKFAVARVEF